MPDPFYSAEVPGNTQTMRTIAHTSILLYNIHKPEIFRRVISARGELSIYIISRNNDADLIPLPTLVCNPTRPSSRELFGEIQAAPGPI